MLIKSSFIVFLLSFSFAVKADKYSYIPASGDKFCYKVIGNQIKNMAVMILDKSEKSNAFHYRWGIDKYEWGTWNEISKQDIGLITDLSQKSAQSGDLVYLNQLAFKQLREGKKTKITIGGKPIVFTKKSMADYQMPIKGTGLKFSAITAVSNDESWRIILLDNQEFPLIIEIWGEVNWVLQSIVPIPSYPVTQQLLGKIIDSSEAKLFNSYVKETCNKVEIKFTEERFNKVTFNEFFCPISGVRFSLKNDTITSLRLLDKSFEGEGLDWQSYQGVIYLNYKIGSNRKEIEKFLGKPISIVNDKAFYPNKGFYLIYNKENLLIEVEYL